MFTVEHLSDSTVVTVLSTIQNVNDLEVIFDEDLVWLRQFDDDKNQYEIIVISNPMWKEMMAAYNCPEGAYVTETK
jgi:hypothetical protein